MEGQGQDSSERPSSGSYLLRVAFEAYKDRPFREIRFWRGEGDTLYMEYVPQEGEGYNGHTYVGRLGVNE